MNLFTDAQLVFVTGLFPSIMPNQLRQSTKSRHHKHVRCSNCIYTLTATISVFDNLFYNCTEMLNKWSTQIVISYNIQSLGWENAVA